MELTDVVNSGSNIQKPMRALSSALIASALAVMACGVQKVNLDGPSNSSKNANSSARVNSSNSNAANLDNAGQVNSNDPNNAAANSNASANSNANHANASSSNGGNSPPPVYETVRIPITLSIESDAQSTFAKLINHYNSQLGQFGYSLTNDKISELAVNIAGETKESITGAELSDYLTGKNIDLSKAPEPSADAVMQTVSLGTKDYSVQSTLVQRFNTIFKPTGKHFKNYLNLLDNAINSLTDKRITPELFEKLQDDIRSYLESR